MTKKKESNPKDSVGVKKIPFSTIPSTVLAEMGVGMLEGARKYGRHNYRVVGVKFSVYYDAAIRHLISSWEGEDIDPDSGLNHITKALTSLTVLRDAMIQGKMVDDRPPPSPAHWMKKLDPIIQEMFNKYPNPVPAYTKKEKKNVQKS